MNLEFPLFVALKNDFNEVKQRVIDKKQLKVGEGQALGFRAVSVLAAACSMYKIFSISKTAIGIFFTLGALHNLSIWSADQSYKTFKGAVSRIGIVGGSIYCSYKMASLSKTAIAALFVLGIAHDYYLWSADKSYNGSKTKWMEEMIFYPLVQMLKKNDESDGNQNTVSGRCSHSHSGDSHATSFDLEDDEYAVSRIDTENSCGDLLRRFVLENSRLSSVVW